MFKIYLNERMILLSDEKVHPAGSVHLKGNETAAELAAIVQSFEAKPSSVILHFISDDIDNSWHTFRSIYIVMDAAGGIVLNGEKQLLMIFRNDRWDLPKGKVEEGETPDITALREVSEETGIGRLGIDRPCNPTYHIYPFKEDHILKCTYWYRMHTTDNGMLVPQREEGIEEVKWMNASEIKTAVKNSYKSVADLLKEEQLA